MTDQQQQNPLESPSGITTTAGAVGESILSFYTRKAQERQAARQDAATNARRNIEIRTNAKRAAALEELERAFNGAVEAIRALQVADRKYCAGETGDGPPVTEKDLRWLKYVAGIANERMAEALAKFKAAR